MKALILASLVLFVSAQPALAQQLAGANRSEVESRAARRLDAVLPGLSIESLPIHFAADAAEYLAAELLINRLHVFAGSQPIKTRRANWDRPRRYDHDPTTNLAIDLLIEQLKLADMRQRLTAEHPALELQRQRVSAVDRQIDRRLRRGDDVDLRLLDDERLAIIASLRNELEQARLLWTGAHPRLQMLKQRNAALDRILR